MKAGSQIIELGLCFVCALAPSTLWTLKAGAVGGAPTGAAVTTERSTLRGVIDATGESTLTVAGRLIATTPATFCTRLGLPVSVPELRAGDEVKVTLEPAGSGLMRAVSIEILAKETTLGPPG